MAIDFSKYKNNSRIDFSEKYDGSYKLKGEEFIKQYNALINTNLDTKFNNPENYRSLVGNSRTLKNYADNNKDALIKYFGNDKYKDIIKQIDNSHNNLVYGLHLSEAVDLQNDVSTALQNWGDKTKLKELKNKAAGVSQRLSSYANMQGANQDYKKQLNLKQINDVVNYNASMAQNMENIFNQYKSKDEYDTALKSYQFLNKYNGKTYADIKNILNTSNQLAEDERKWLNSYQYEVMTEDEINKELSSIEANVNNLREQIKKDDAISGGSQKQLMPSSMTAEQKAAFERIQQNTNKINELSSLEQLLKTNLAQKTQLREFEEKWKESAGKKGSVSYENPFDKYAEDLGIGLNDQEFAGYLTNKKYFDLMTEDEKNSYDWIMENKGEDQALEYFNDLADARLDKRYNEDIIKNTFNYASSGGWQGALSTLGSVVTSLSSGLEYAVNTLSGNSDRRSTFSSMTSGLREGTKSNWDGTPGEEIWDFLYDTGTSALDSLTAAGISVVTTPAVGAAVLGGSAAASTANDLLDRGATGGQVVLGSVAAGVFEGLFEKISLGNLKNLATKSAPAIIKELGWSKAGVKNLAKEIGKTVFVNASEEMNTEIANIIYDGLMNGELSQYATTVQQYVSEGDSIEDAKRKASQEITEQVVTAGLSGGLMGFGFGGLGTASGGISNALANNKIGRTILSDKNKLDSFKSMAKTSANESIVSAVNKLSISSKASDVGREFRRYASEVINDAKSQLINELNKNGASEKGDNSAGVLAEKIINTVLEPDSVQNKAAKILIASNDIAGSVYMDFVHNGNFGGNDIKQLSNIIKSSSRNVKNIDTNNAVVYNNKRGEGYVPTDEFRELQAASKGMSEEERRRYLRGGANETVRDRISAVFKRQLDTWRSGGSSYNGLLNLTAKGNQFNIYENVDGRIFHDIFEITRNYLQNGELVDLHEVETTENGIGYDDCYNYLSEDGLSGFSITPDGDLISVFNASGKKGFLRAIAPIVKEKAKTLDCYVSPQQNLMEMYEKSFGFKTASLMDYNMEYDHDNIAENHSSPQIAFMVNTPQEVEIHHFNENQYEEAVQYRDSFVLDSDNSVVNNDKEGIVSVDNSETKVAKESPSKTDSTKNISKKIYGRTKQSIEEQKNAVEIGKRLGLEVDFNYKGRANGKITGNKVSINPNAKDPIAFILKHEFLHYLENSKNFDKFLNYVLNDSPAFKQWLKGKNFNSLASAIQDVYNRYGNIGYSKAKIEVVGDFVGDKLFGPRDLKIDENFLKELQKSNRNIFERILDWIKSRIRMLKGTPVEKDLIRLEQKMIRLKETLGKDISNDSESDTKHSYAGRKTPVSDLDTLSKAKKLADEGKDPEYIRKKTGWFQGYEGKWRFEIDDSDAEFYLDNLKIGGRYKLGTLMHHNALYKAYPQLKNIDVYITDSNNYKGYADSSQNVIELSLNRNEGDLDKTLIHEVQHLIQNYEQFSAGSSNDYWHKRLSDDISDNFFQKRDNLFKLVDDSGIKNFNRYFLDYDEFSDQDINSPETKKAYEKIINKFKDDKIINAFIDYHNAKIKYDNFLKNDSKMAFDAYMNTAGEIEARDVSNRLRYTEQERKNESPNLGEKDVLFIEEPQENSQSTKNESINDEYEYTESQYNNFGWASYNNVITPREREVLLSRYADFKHNKNKYPVTKSGEAVISSSECPDVIMYVTGNISNPQIKKIVRITATNPVDVEIIRSEILNYEYEHISLPYSAFEDAYGTGIFRYYESRDTASFQEYKATREGKDSKTSNKVSRREQNRGRSLSENKESNRTKSNVNHKNGFYQKVLKNNAKSSENYTEEQYNNFGWASYNNVITPKEREILFSRYADFKHNKETYPVTKDGEAVIYSSECPDVIMYVSGSISNPKISLIIRINDIAYSVSAIREVIIRNEQKQELLPFKAIMDTYGPGVLDLHSKRRYAPFRSIQGRGEGGHSEAGDSLSGREQNRERKLSENRTNDEAGVDKPAFSIPSDDDISYENLFKMVENGEITSDEAIDMLNSRYGRIETGVDPKVDVKIPKKISEDKNVRRYVRTAAESGHLDDGMTAELKKNIVKGALAYQPISDQAAMNKADKTVKEDFKGAVQRWESIVSGDKTLSKFDITLGERLLQQAAENGATSDVIKYIAELAEVGTRMGQNIQALSLLKKMTGIGQLYYIQRSVDSLNRDIEAKYKGKKAEIKIDPDYAQILADSKTQQDTEDIANDMLKDIADQVPSSLLDKWNAWRYMSMLGNPRTHIRNIVGNAVFLPTVRLKDAIAYVMEKTVSPEKRTKSFLVKRQYRKFAEQDFDQMYDIITGGGKMNPADRLREQQRIFNNKALEGSRRLIFNALEKEDAVFLKRHYVHALGSFLQARNLDVSSMSAEDLNKARVYAVKEAQKATYRDASDVASALGRFQYSNKKTVRAIGYFVEGILPFKKTPINILKRGIEYSPAGLLLDIGKGLKSLIDYKAIDKRIKNGEITEQQGAELKAAGMTASEFIDGLASGLTGTGIMVLGMLLQSLGVLTGGLDDDEDDELERMTGAQEYSLTVNGHSYTIDWMAPSVLPFLVGGEIAKYFSDTDSESGVLGRVIDALTAIGEPLINLSMLSGLNDTIEAVAYSDNKLTDMIITTALSYLSQAIPTLGGQIARTADDTRRTNYVDKNSEIPSSIQMFLQKSAGKIPFLENQKVPYINEWGEMESNGSILNRALENFVSPGYYNKIETDRLNSEIARLYTETDNKDVIPKRAAKSFSVDGKTKYLSAEEYLDYATEKGRRSRKYAEDLITHPLYNDLNDFEKAEALKNLYDYANAVAKLKVPDYELSSSYSKIKDLEENGLDPVDYYIAKALTDVSRADKDSSWTVSKSEYIRALRESGLSEETQKQLINNRYPKKTK